MTKSNYNVFVEKLETIKSNDGFYWLLEDVESEIELLLSEGGGW